MSHSKSNWWTILLGLLFAFSCSCIAEAQLKVEVGEQVKVAWLSSWLDGYVIDIEKRMVLVEYEFAGTTKQKAFPRKDVRRMYEYNGLDFGRNWESASGKFKVEASIAGFDGDSVRLLKPDLSELTVEIEKLSQKDVAYANKFKKMMELDIKRGLRPAPVPKLPELEDFGLGGYSSSVTFGSDSELVKLGAIPSYLKNFQQGGVGYKLIRDKQELVAIIPVGGPDQLVLMSFRESNSFNKGDLFQSQLYWVSLKKKRVVNYVAITHEDYAIDYNPRHKLLLTFNRGESFSDRGDLPDHYTLWELQPGSDTAEPLRRWQGEGVGWSKSLFGKVVNDHLVVVKTDKSSYQAFDLNDKQIAYELHPESFFGAPVVISQDRQNLIVPEDGRVSIVDAATGEFKFSASVSERHVSGANINDAGTKLAAVTERNVYVWNLESPKSEPEVYPAPLMSSPFRSRIEWIDDDHLLGQSHRSRILYRLSQQMPIWSYEMNLRLSHLNSDPSTNMVVDGKFFYVARPDRFGSTFAVGAVDLPGPKVAEITADVQRESLMMLKPGTAVGLQMDNVSDSDEVKAWLLEKMKVNGWVYDANADIVLHASMGVGENQQVAYEEEGTGKIENVNFKPHFAKIKLMRDKLVIWQTGTRTGPPSRVIVKQGQTYQSEVNKFAKPRIDFFQSVKLDAEIMDPKFSRGFGKSTFGVRGIEVVSTTPPGREDDPLAAAKQAEEDRRKAAEDGQGGGDDQGGVGQR